MGARDRIQMQVKSFTCERSWYGTYHRQRFFSVETMDTHVGKMSSRGWNVLTQVAHTGQGRGLRPFAKRDTITIPLRKLGPANGGRAFPPNKSFEESRLSHRFLSSCPSQPTPASETPILTLGNGQA